MSNFIVKEVESIKNGRCFTIYFKNMLALGDETKIKLKRKDDLVIYIHNCGDEFWLNWIEFPFDISTFQLNVKSNEDAIRTSILFSETHTEYMDKVIAPCADYNSNLDESYKWDTSNLIECCRKNFQAQLLTNISCSIVGLKPFLSSESKIAECQTKEDAVKMYRVYKSLLKQFKGKPELLGCQYPCFSRTYNVKWMDFHKNYLIEDQEVHEDIFFDQHYYLSFSYQDFTIEEKVETLVYDFGSFLTSIGGNLGLFLGFSCFSLLVSIIEMLKEKF